MRYELEQFEIPFDVVYPQDIDARNLKSKYDVLVFPSDQEIGASGGQYESGRPDPSGSGRGRDDEDRPATRTVPAIPKEFQRMQGLLTVETTLPAVKQFLEDGGTVIAVGYATSLGSRLGLPIEDHLAVRSPGKADRKLTKEEFYIPGSIVEVAVDETESVAAGLPQSVDMFFNSSPVFRLKPDAARQGTKAVAWFDNAAPLRSGWAWGQKYLEGGAAVVASDYGRGKVYLFGPEITFRGQPHGTFKFLFNAIYAPTSAAQPRAPWGLMTSSLRGHGYGCSRISHSHAVILFSREK